jgi:predicted RNA-binding Zn-ribbon protein involved in translation (DUF1610 family)
MSHAIDDVYEVYDERRPRARKPHACGACGEAIRVGDRYVSVFIVFDGDASTVKRCRRCQKIHEHLRGIDPGEVWPDEHLACGEGYREHWGRDPPPEIAALAFAGAGR